MKKIMFLIAVVAVLGLTTKPANAAKSTCTTIQSGTLLNSVGEVITTGYDKWGYNYQANMFNGKYCDAYRDAAWCQQFKGVNLMMKWNNAWLSNQDCNLDGKLDRASDPPGTYIGSGAWLTNHATGSYLSTKTWNIVGDWVLSFDYLGSFYIHDMTVADNTFTGTGGYPSGAEPYSITWTVTGTLIGDNMTMHIEYDGSSYYVDAVGTIAPDGTMGGTWSNGGQSGTWASTFGVATRPMCTVSDFVKVVAVPTDADNSTIDAIKCPDNLYDGNKLWKTAGGEEIGCSIWGSFAIIQEIASDPCSEYGVIDYMSPLRKGLGNWAK